MRNFVVSVDFVIMAENGIEAAHTIQTLVDAGKTVYQSVTDVEVDEEITSVEELS